MGNDVESTFGRSTRVHRRLLGPPGPGMMPMVAACLLSMALVGGKSEARQLRGGIANARPSNELTALQRAQAAPMSKSTDVLRVSIGNDIWLEKMRGDVAVAHLYNLLSRRPEAFANVRQRLESRGFEKTPIVYVERTVRLAAGLGTGGTGGNRLTQSYQESNAEGEIVLWSWDDGDDNTWEGAIYVEVYSTGQASTWEGQIDASTSAHPWVWYDMTWQGGGGPGGPPEARFEEPPLPGTGVFRFASISQLLSPAPVVVPVGWTTWAKCWRQNVVGGCGAAAIGCIATGPGWGACFGFTCVGVEVAFAVACAL